MMKKIAIIYHSGVGNTKKIAEKVAEQITQCFSVEAFSVEGLPESFNLDDYDGLVIGFPVIHTHPTVRILNFINGIKKLPRPKPAYLFTTCGLYSANTLRIFAKESIKKNIIPIVYRDFAGCPATDGALIAPLIDYFFRFPKDIDAKITDDVLFFCEKIRKEETVLNMPKFKLYSILNYPNKVVGQQYTFPIYVHKSKCVKCDKCIINCPSKALEKGFDGFPVFVSATCEKCYRCIHHCPCLALSLCKRRTPKRVLGG